MTKKPRGRKYRNLMARSGAIYCERVWEGKPLAQAQAGLEQPTREIWRALPGKVMRDA